MKITAVQAFAVQLPGMWTNYAFVKVSTDDGIIGWGECSVGIDSVVNVVEELGATLVGKDPFRIEEGGHADYDVLLQQPFPKQKDGYLDLPTGPGIGVELNEEALAAYPSPGMVPQDYHEHFKFPSRQQAHWI
jgi:L-alanine-DL-glutamate epimerase-like enolase superfamily enzyme